MIQKQFHASRPDGTWMWIYHILAVAVRFIWTSFLALLWFLLSYFRSDGHQSIPGPIRDVARFISSFENRFGRRHPVFYREAYDQALSDVKQELRFLLVYLHNEDSRPTDQFCRDVLCNTAFINFVNSGMLFWACSVKSPEGMKVSRSLRERAYPFLALLVLRDGRITQVARVEGYIQGTQALINRLQAVMAENEESLEEERERRAIYDFNQSLRQQQDEAYLESLKMDQEKDRKKHEELLKRQQECEQREQQHQERELQKIQILKLLPPEPEPHCPDSVYIVLKMPNGRRIERRFLRSQSLKFLFYFVFCLKDSPEDFQIVTNFPRRKLPCEPIDGQRDPPSFREVGLGNSEMLFVHDNQA